MTSHHSSNRGDTEGDGDTEGERGQPERPASLRSSFTSRLIAAVSVCAVLVIGVYYSFVQRPLREKLVGLGEAEVRLLFRGLRGQVQATLTSAQREIRAIASLPAVRSFRKERLDAALRQADETTTLFKKFTVLDTAGAIASRPSMPGSVGQDRSSRGYFRGVADTRGLFFDELRIFEDGPSLSIGMPILGTNGEFRGVLAGHISWSGQSAQLCRLNDGWATRVPHEAVLLTEAGHKLVDSAGPVQPASFAAVDYRGHPLSATTEGEPVSSVYTLDGTEYFGLASRIEPAKWLLLLQVERGPLVASANSALDGIEMVFWSVFLGSLGVVALYGSRLIRPIDRLTASIASYGASGTGHPLASGKVVGEIAAAVHAFNHMVVERSQTESELRRQRRELQDLAAELSRVEQHTRREVAGELHDQISQDLAATKIRLELLHEQQGSVPGEEHLLVAIELLRGCIVRTSQLTNRLSQPAIEHLGVVKALDSLVANYQAQHESDFQFECDDTYIAIDADTFDIVYRGAGELLHNIIKHASASQVLVRLQRDHDELVIEVADDGVGFTPNPQQPREGQVGGYGLFGLKERLRGTGGGLTVESAPNRGCLVTIRVPIANVQAATTTRAST